MLYEVITGPGLDHRSALPRLPPRLVIDLGGPEGVGKFPPCPVGAEANVITSYSIHYTKLYEETSFVGLPFAFVRLSGCNLRCRYCDTTYAYDDGEEISYNFV